MIDYGIVIVMLPLVLVGSFVGVIFNIMLPSIILSIMLTIVLVLLTFQSARKGCQLYSKESEKKRRKEIEMKKGGSEADNNI